MQQQNQYGVQYPPDRLYGTLQPGSGASMLQEGVAGAPINPMMNTMKPTASTGPIAPMKAHGAQLQDARA